MLCLLLTLPLVAQDKAIAKPNPKQGELVGTKTAPPAGGEGNAPPAMEFRSRFQPVLEFTVPAGVAVGKVADALGFGFGGVIGASLALDRWAFFSRLAASRLTNRLGLSVGGYYFATQNSSPQAAAHCFCPRRPSGAWATR